MIKKVSNRINRIKNEKAFKNTFTQYSPSKNSDRKILMYVGIGYMYLTQFEILAYHLLKREGCEVDYHIYDDNVKINEIITHKVFNEEGKKPFWDHVQKNALKWLKLGDVNYDFINCNNKKVNDIINNITSLDEILAFETEGVKVGDIIQATMYRFYKSKSFGENALEYGKMFLHTSLSNLYHFIDLQKKNNYDYTMFSHGIYVTWGAIVEYCKNNNINFVCYDRAKQKNSININYNQVAPDWSINRAWERYSDKNLNDKELAVMNKYVQDRELQKNDVFAYNFSKKENDISKLKNELGIKPNAKVITIFTNLIWDAANVGRDLAFPDPLNCITETMDKFAGNDNVHVVVRTHPAEKVLGTNEQYSKLIYAHYNGKLPSNASVIEPSATINSFSVIEMSDIGVVNTSTVGLEFAQAGKPILLISETHYRGKGFTYDVESKEEYFNKLEGLTTSIEILPNQVKLADKYFYMMMFEYQKKVPVSYENNVFKKFDYTSLNEIPADSTIMKIVKSIAVEESNDDFLFWD